MTAIGLHPDLSRWETHIDRVLDSPDFGTVFQPIVDLKRRTVVGYEALTRFGEVDGQYLAPNAWFDAAAALGLTAQLDARALMSALAARSDLPRNCFLSVNLDPDSLSDRTVLDVLLAQGSLAGVVIEITEHRPCNWDQLAVPMQRLRSHGAMFAVDDAGTGYSGLQQILQLRPQILKLDRAIITGVHEDEAKRSLIEMLGIFANRIDAWILAEGIESPSEAQALIDLDVPLVQGYYFARPGPRWSSIDPLALTELRQVPVGRSDTLHRLVEPLPPIATNVAEKRHAGPRRRWIAVVDDDGRPLGLRSDEDAIAGVLRTAITANVNTSPREIGQRVALTNGDDPHAPVIVVDSAGRYLGLLSMRRLIRSLSASDDH